jgi:hypothetical protein
VDPAVDGGKEEQMKTVLRISIVTIVLGFMVMADIPQLPVQLVPEAEAIFGVRRRVFRRAVIIGAVAEEGATSSGAKSQSTATAQQQSATAQQQSATAQQQSVTAQQQSAAVQKQAAAGAPPAQPAGGGKPLPLGTVVSALPPGCVATPVGGVEYYYGAGNFYRAVFQGNKLVYVTAKPE